MADRLAACPHCAARLDRDFRGRACPECGAALRSATRRPAADDDDRESRYPRRHWVIFKSSALAAGLSLIAVLASWRYYQGKKDRPAHPGDEPAEVVSAETARPPVVVPPPPGISVPKQPAGPPKDAVKAPAPVPPPPVVKQDSAAPESLKGAGPVFLESAVPDQAFVQGNLYGLLRREVVRQAVLLAAREDFGLDARDGALGEPAPDRLPPACRFRTTTAFPAKKAASFRLEQGDPAARKTVLSAELPATSKLPDWLVHFTGSADALARTEVADTFRRAGLALPEPPARETAVPDGVEARLGTMTIPAQFAAVRQLHAAGRAGASPGLLGALARAYANLGVLTEHLWSVDHKVFKARALLYAERLVKLRPNDPSALRHRAYVLALCGTPAAALADLKAAAQLPAAGPVPAWVDLLEPFCKYEDEKLEALADAAKPEVAGLARLLCFLAVEDPDTAGLTLAAAGKLLEDAPECTRVLATVTITGHVGSRHRSTATYLNVLADEMPARVAELPGLPEAAVAKARAKAPEPELWRALAEAAAQDRGEPSWATLGRLLREDRFVSIWRRVDFMKNAWSVPVEEFVEEVQPLLEGHPYKDVIRLYALDPKRDREAYRKLAFELPAGDLDLQCLGAIAVAQPADPNAFGLVQRAFCHVDFTDREFARAISISPHPSQAMPFVRDLQEFSPHAPAGIGAMLAFDPSVPAAKIADWEKNEGHQAAVQRALAKRYAAAGKFADAERCWRAYLKRSPDTLGYKQLAELLKARGDLAQWKATLDEFLKQEDQDLGHARVRVDVARYLMKQKKWEEARPYAEKAAETWAAWAMICAGDCLEGLGEWEKSELWVKRTSERYPHLSFDWVFWCLRTGKGDLAAARRLAEGYVRDQGDRAGANEVLRLAFLHSGVGDEAGALELYERLAKTVQSEILGLLIAGAADAAGQKGRRDRALGDFTGTSAFAKVAKAFREALAAGEKQAPDLKAIEAALQEVEEKAEADGYYLVARFLEARGRGKEAAPYYDRCVLFPRTSPEVRALAAARLRALGLTPKFPK
jgi:tetratricopeptide (TPR) repeat protein